MWPYEPILKYEKNNAQTTTRKEFVYMTYRAINWSVAFAEENASVQATVIYYHQKAFRIVKLFKLSYFISGDGRECDALLI